MANPRYARQRVRGYVRADGTRVRGHYRTRAPQRTHSPKADIDPGLIILIVLAIFLAAIGANLA